MLRLIVMLLLMNLVKGSNSSNEISKGVTHFLTKLCPESNICRGNASAYPDPESTSTSCCTDCSCAPDCEDTGNCCFATNNQTLHYRKDNNFVRKEDVLSQCLFALSGESEVLDFKNYRSYHMISSIPKIEQIDHIEPCGNKRVGPWGSLFPVFSKEANAIYKNGLCAKFDNITDSVVWEAILKCRDYRPENLPAHIERGLIPAECRVQFRYPGDLKDIQSHICYRDMIDACTATEFKVPISINATKYEITEACLGGLVSPYYGHRYSLYANVFCYICSGFYFNENNKCSKFEDEKKLFENRGGFFGVLNIDAFNSRHDDHTADLLSNRKISACPTNTKQETVNCRPVHCPSGQVRNMDKCVFPMQQWYLQGVDVCLELDSEEQLEISKVFEWLKSDRSAKSIERLSMPNVSKLKGWAIISALYKDTNLINDTNTKSILVYLSRSFGPASPINIIQNIGLLRMNNWSLKYDNKTLILKPSMCNVMGFPDHSLLTSHFKINDTLAIQRPAYTQFYNDPNDLQTYGILITKLHFCEQIELVQGEYYLSDDRKILYNTISQQYLFNGEFALLSGILEETVRICLEGSGFAKNNSAKSAAIASYTAAVPVTIVLTLNVLLVSAHAGRNLPGYKTFLPKRHYGKMAHEDITCNIKIKDRF